MLIIPFTSVGGLSFSDTRHEIRRKLNESFSSGVKGDEDSPFKDYYDYFEGTGLFVCYDENDKINAFEFFEGIPIFNGINLLKESFTRLIEILSEFDPDLECDHSEFTSTKYGLSGGAAYNDDGDITTVESILIFKKGYYDAVNAYIASLE